MISKRGHCALTLTYGISMTLKLFKSENTGWGGGFVVVLAESLEQAKQMARDGHYDAFYGDWMELENKPQVVAYEEAADSRPDYD